MSDSVSGLVNIFERKKFDRVVMSGHGIYFTSDGKITVPDGIVINFYVNHGDLTNNVLGMAVENRFSSSTPPTPVESFKGGDQVFNYRLGFGSRLDLAGSLSTYKYEWITVNQVDRLIPLSVLLQDSRCQPPCTIHWAACREIRAGATGANDVYFTRAEKSLNLVSNGSNVAHTVKMPGKVQIPNIFQK